ncbi:phosphoglycolate phosphatase [Chromatiales bacterium (ex Bugula neritina AB1)]|nr:phosphoglycolate phosphatase [Chromatiales bacterium (ex Bugula neritina AB1)]
MFRITKDIEVLVWDLDGTLVDSISDIHAALNIVLKDYKLPAISLEQARAMVGAGAGKLLERAFDAVGGMDRYHSETVYNQFSRYYSANSCVESQLYPGITEALVQLKTNGFRHAICTNKPEAIARSILQQLSIDHLFDAVVGGDTTPNRKPDPAPLQHCLSLMDTTAQQALMIGDSAADVGVARAVAVPVILLPWGYRSESLDALAADVVVQDAPALIRILAI